MHGFTKYGTGDPELAYVERERIEKQRVTMEEIINDPTTDGKLRKKLSNAKLAKSTTSKNGVISRQKITI